MFNQFHHLRLQGNCMVFCYCICNKSPRHCSQKMRFCHCKTLWNMSLVSPNLWVWTNNLATISQQLVSNKVIILLLRFHATVPVTNTLHLARVQIYYWNVVKLLWSLFTVYSYNPHNVTLDYQWFEKSKILHVTNGADIWYVPHKPNFHLSGKHLNCLLTSCTHWPTVLNFYLRKQVQGSSVWLPKHLQ